MRTHHASTTRSQNPVAVATHANMAGSPSERHAVYSAWNAVRELVRSDDAIDVAVLKRLAGEPWVMERTHKSMRGVTRLWAACGLPDYRAGAHDAG